MLIVTLGAVKSTVPVTVAVLLLPAVSLTLAVTVKSPSLRSAIISAVYVPSAFVIVVSVCSLPSLSVITKVTSVPAGTSITLPLTDGVTSFVSSIGLIVIAGSVKSISPVSLAEAVLPAASVTVATTLNWPSTNSLLASTDQLPSAPVTTCTVSATPSLPVNVTVTTAPGSTSWVEPLTVGVVSLVSIIKLILTVKSTLPTALACASLPESSITAATTVKSPSGRGVVTCADHEPSSCVTASNVNVLPSLAVIVKVMVVPAGTLPVLPLKNGVVSLVLAIASI